MSRRSRALDRYRDLDAEDLDHDHAELAAQMERDADRLAGASDVEVTPVHLAVVELLDELLSLASQSSGTDTTYSPMLRLVRRFKPMLLRDFAKVPPEVVTTFMRELGTKMLDAVGGPAAADESRSA